MSARARARCFQTSAAASSGFTVPTVNFTAGVGSSYDLTQHVPGWNSSTMALLVQGTLPASVTFNGTALVYDGTGGATSVSGVTLVIIML